MKINGNSVKPGMILEHNGELWTVAKSQSVKPGKGGAFNQVEMKNIKTVFHEKNSGKGSAIKSGLKISEGDIILIQDADLEYDPNDYEKLFEPFFIGRVLLN